MPHKELTFDALMKKNVKALHAMEKRLHKIMNAHEQAKADLVLRVMFLNNRIIDFEKGQDDGKSKQT